ncbi:dTDP-4-dehydrorhamnose 3,5-epimerase [Terribacillus saccharophilus]|uniref:dTDP-4-dehydrorhamnose 3,5-epimerase n=1 Tax=Terribacillus saccharophilus TaxID=361277 RepID=UPI000BA792E3|nr:dTDP-4-dehydrorhamnose 3,5-epimerase [Terribacillus saccharophilus]PAF18122.1 dTDP-4-dehydrorhamnose 3,5-epimerase [Terribacillus saccharophilus]
MELMETKLSGVVVISPTVHGDNRGWFMETHSSTRLIENGIHLNFVQDNHSFSSEKGTLRGLHYQMMPKAQTKLVRCTRGSIYDVAVDLRVDSPTFKQWFGIELSAENKKQLLVPKGFAHGFITLTNDVEVQYKVDEVYSPEHDRNILWNDPEIGIEWPALEVTLSEKDRNAPLLRDADNNFRVEN